MLISTSALTGVTFQVIGSIDGSGKIVLKDRNQAAGDPVPVDLDLEKVLGDMPRKTYNFQRSQLRLTPHQLPQGEAAAASSLPLSLLCCLAML